MNVGPSFFSRDGSANCPDYSTVTLRFTSDTYSAPSGDVADLQFLPCPYDPPTVE